MRSTAIAVLAAASVTACSSSHPQPKDTAPSFSISIPPLATEPLPASLAPSYNSTGPLPGATKLAAELLPLPAGTTEESSAWSRNTTPTIDEFVSEKYGSTARAQLDLALAQIGVDGIAHRIIDGDVGSIEIVLLHIDGTATQAFLGHFIPDLAGGAEPFAVSVPGGEDAYAARAKTVSSDGTYELVVVTMVGSTVLALNGAIYDPADVATVQAWANDQLERLTS